MSAAFFVLVEVSEGGGEAFAGAREIGGGPGLPKKAATLWRKHARSCFPAGSREIETARHSTVVKTPPNSCSVSYPLSTAAVISEVNTALASCDRNTMLTEATRLDGFNNLPCPLGGPAPATVSFRN